MNGSGKSLVLWTLLGAVLTGGALYALLRPQPAEQLPVVGAVPRVETAPMCPWREPEADLRRFFPVATGYDTEVLVLSGVRGELAQRLGRQPTAEENALYVYPVHGSTGNLGTVLVRRVKGESGAIEVVLAVDTGGRVVGVRLQRYREPEVVAAVLKAPTWLRGFHGKTAESDWGLGGGIAPVPKVALPSALAVVDGVRSMLILLQVAQQRGVRKSAPHSDHAAPGHP